MFVPAAIEVSVGKAVIKPMMRSLNDAPVNMRGLREVISKQGRRQKKNKDDTEEMDNYNGPDGGSSGGQGDGSSSNRYQPDSSRRPETMSEDEYLRLLDSSVHNPDGVEAVLGKYSVPGTDSYIAVAEAAHPPASYFSLGDQWGSIAETHGLSDAGMFDAFNAPFLERIMAEGKPIIFSHNPLDFPGSALASELDFLLGNGYVFDAATMRAFLP